MTKALLPLLLSALCLALAGSFQQVAAETSEVLGFHGSGSTAISNCMWYTMQSLNFQTKIATYTTYRAVGSGTGISEFMGNITHSYNDFGCADFPLPKQDYDTLQNASQGMIHIPLVMGSVGVFNSLPIQQPDASSTAQQLNVNLTGCLVARIYQGEILDWTHPDIVAINPNMNLPVQLDFYGNPKANQSFPMTIIYRNLGSGTTMIFTTYLYKICPQHWGIELVGDAIQWPITGKSYAIGVEGTASMVRVLQATPGAIGYSNTGLALQQGAQESALQMEQTSLKQAFFLTSANAESKDGIAAAVNSATIPNSADADWSGVDVINKVQVSMKLFVV